MVGDTTGKGRVTLWLRGPWAGLQGGGMAAPWCRAPSPSAVPPAPFVGAEGEAVGSSRCVLPAGVFCCSCWLLHLHGAIIEGGAACWIGGLEPEPWDQKWRRNRAR